MDDKRVTHSSAIKKKSYSNRKMQAYRKGLCPYNARIVRKEISTPTKGKWHLTQGGVFGYTRVVFYLQNNEEGGLGGVPVHC